MQNSASEMANRKEILFNKDYHYRAHITKTIVNSLKNFCDSTEEFIDLNSTTKVWILVVMMEHF